MPSGNNINVPAALREAGLELPARQYDGKANGKCLMKDDKARHQHGDRNASFVIFLNSGQWQCACGEGDLVSLFMEARGMSLVDACRLVVKHDGIVSDARAQELAGDLTEGRKMIGQWREEFTGAAPAPSPKKKGGRKRAEVTVESYASAFMLDADRLRSHWGLTDDTARGFMAIPYADAQGLPLYVKSRCPDGAKQRFDMDAGITQVPYGLAHLEGAKEVVVVEGESDVHVLDEHGIAAVGCPGAKPSAHILEMLDAALDGVPSVIVVQEPGPGGEDFIAKIATTSFAERARLVIMTDPGDPADLHRLSPQGFPDAWKARVAAAPFLLEHIDEERRAARDEEWPRCEALATDPMVLDRMVADAERAGLAGESMQAKVLFLAVVSRRLDTPVSTITKAESSSGKSWTIKRVLDFFPRSAYVSITSMSPKALIYSREELAHRMLYVGEANGAEEQEASYLLRHLVSEGFIRHEVVIEDKKNGGHTTRVVEKEGPTGLITSTARAEGVDPELENRMILLSSTDTVDQTLAVLESIATRPHRAPMDFSAWHAFDRWIGLSRTDAVVPRDLAVAIYQGAAAPSIRWRRDFSQFLNLMRAHALLRQVDRHVDERGRVECNLEDYAVIHEVFASIMAETAGAALPQGTAEVLESIERVKVFVGADWEGASVTQIMSQLPPGLDLTGDAVRARLRRGVEAGFFIVNEMANPKRYMAGERALEGASEEAMPHPARLALSLGEAIPAVAVRQAASDPRVVRWVEQLRAGEEITGVAEHAEHLFEIAKLIVEATASS